MLMKTYDIFFQNHHPLWADRLLVWCNKTLFSFLRRQVLSRGPIRVLEIGPGKGYFYRASQSSEGISYVATDRNTSFQTAFPDVEFHQGSVPSLPADIGTFDMIYAAYVIEHLADGLTLAEFAKNCAEHLREGGVLVVTCPDALKQQFEFFNMDYTHRYPTTERNVTMALSDSGFVSTRIYPISGLLTLPGFYVRPVFWLLRISMFWYHHRWMQFLFGWLVRVPLSSLQNPFYRFYCLAKQENLLFIAKKQSHQ